MAARQAFSAKFARENGLDYAAETEVIVSNGAKQVIFDALMATLEPGDEVVLCAPYFGQYKDMVLILGGVPVTVKAKAEDGFCLTPKALEDAITPNTRWIILNSPSNPAGATYDDATLRRLGRSAARSSSGIDPV